MTQHDPTQPRHTCTEQPSSPSTRTYQHRAAGDGTDPDVDAHAAAGRPEAPVVWCDGVGSSVEPGLLFDMIGYYFGATTRRTLRSPTRPNRQPFDANIHSHRSRSVVAREKMYSGEHSSPSPPIRHNQGRATTSALSRSSFLAECAGGRKGPPQSSCDRVRSTPGPIRPPSRRSDGRGHDWLPYKAASILQRVVLGFQHRLDRPNGEPLIAGPDVHQTPSRHDDDDVPIL